MVVVVQMPLELLEVKCVLPKPVGFLDHGWAHVVVSGSNPRCNMGITRPFYDVERVSKQPKQEGTCSTESQTRPRTRLKGSRRQRLQRFAI